MQEPVINHSETIVSTPAFIGLKAYAEEDASFFFGRVEEIAALYQLIKSNTLTIVFGKSGTGKTSLLNAGVFPKLRAENCLPFRIRLEFQDNSPTLLAQIREVLKTQIEKYGFKIKPFAPTETLWEFFHREDLWKIVTPVLIFDQFEEIFTLTSKHANKKEELAEMMTELADLIENTIPEKLKIKYLAGEEKIAFNYKSQKAKTIFAFREDYLPEMESITKTIPSVRNSRFRLKPMNGKQAFEVITKTWGKAIEETEAEKIVSYLTNETETSKEDIENKKQHFDWIEIEPSLLSQVCTYLDKEKTSRNLDKISKSFLQDYSKGIALRSVYHKALDECNVTDGKKDTISNRNRLQEFIEDNLITAKGFRTRFATKEISSNLEPGINILKQKYFIREEGPSIELIHDVIATIVKNDRDERLRVLAIKQTNLRAKKRVLAIVALIAIIVAVASGMFSSKQLGNAKDAIKITEEKQKEANTLDTQIEESGREIEVFKAKYSKLLQPAKGENNEELSFAYADSILNDYEAKIAEDSMRHQLLLEKINSMNGKLSGNTDDEKLINHYETIIADQNKLIDYYKQQLSELPGIKRDAQTQKTYLRMYQSHIDSIIKFKSKPLTLEEHINLIEQHREGFKRVLKY